MKGRAAVAVLLLLLGGAAMAPALATVRAALDTSQIAAGDTVQLTLEHDGHTSGQPDLSPLRQNFDILGTSSSTTVEIVNFSASEKTEVVLTLAPKATGQLTIPALSWDGERTQPLSLEVTGPGGAAQPGTSGAPSAPKVFIEASASPEQPYVEAAVHLTVRLFTSETLYHADLELPSSSDAVVKQVGPDENSQAERDGQNYQVVTRQYLLFPLHSGKLTLPGPVLDAEVAVNQRAPSGNDPFGGFFSGLSPGGFLRTVRPVRLNGNPIVLAVRPRPAGAVGSYWLPASEVTLSAAWNPAQLSAPAGDPVTLDLDLQATGLTAAQLPDISSLLSFPPGLKAYPDQPKLDDSARSGQLVGSRDQTIALMADSPGHYTIPALTVTWWDTQANRPRVATLPARTLSILPAPGIVPAGITTQATSTPPAAAPRTVPRAVLGGTSPTPHVAPGLSPPTNPSAVAARRHTPARSSSEWEWLSIGLATVWVATLGAWLWSRRSRTVPGRSGGGGSPPNTRQLPPDPAKERAAFRAACEANDPRAARAHLLAWTTALWGTTPSGVNSIAARVGDPTVAELLRDLDRACYAGGTWQGGPLVAALPDLPAPPAKSPRQRDGLAPLYP
ncbi:MAG TPA: BatD family protein [Steroidobacteraceae bacterium]|nr:BatD family protein [Steroidobacteraceae bacterium]